MDDQATASTFSSCPVAQQHPTLGTLFPGWNHGLDPAKLEQVYAAQRERGAKTTLHTQAVAVTRDADGCVWDEKRREWVDPAAPPAAAAAPAAKPAKAPKPHDEKPKGESE